jgi:hypothetical protein
LQAEAAKYKEKDPSWNFIYVPEPEIPNDEKMMNSGYAGYEFVRAKGGTSSGVYLFSSIKLMQRCDGFIGHFGSGMAYFMYQLMCLQHGSRGLFELNKYETAFIEKSNNIINTHNLIHI